MIYLEDEELRTLLECIVSSYNDYLVQTYADLKVPGDEISVIDYENQDILESLDLLRTAMKNLAAYCEEQQDDIRAYRSWNTGLSLEDLERKVELVQDVNVDYLYSYVYTNSIVRDPETMLTKYQFDLRNAQTQLDVVNQNIATTKNILDSYKNDEIYVSMQESDGAKSTRTTTDYYNELIVSQANNYAKAAELEITIGDLQDKIANLQTVSGAEATEQAASELEKAMKASKALYEEVASHIQEILDSPSYRLFLNATVPQEKTESFLTGASKNMLMFGAVGAVIALALWFCSALAPELGGNNRREETDNKTKTNNKPDESRNEEGSVQE